MPSCHILLPDQAAQAKDKTTHVGNARSTTLQETIRAESNGISQPSLHKQSECPQQQPRKQGRTNQQPRRRTRRLTWFRVIQLIASYSLVISSIIDFIIVTQLFIMCVLNDTAIAIRFDQENKRKNLSLLDPNYDPDDQQPPSGSLATPRPTYSPVTPASVEEYLQPRTPGTPYLPGTDDRFDQQLGDYAPAGQLARLSSNNETAMDCLQMLR